MAMTLPNIPMAYSPSFSDEMRVRRVQFGDGYSLRSEDGLNPLNTKVNAVWRSIQEQEMRTLKNFFEVHKGAYWFWWIPTGYSTQKKFICSSWTYEPVKDARVGLAYYWDFNASFELVHDIG